MRIEQLEYIEAVTRLGSLRRAVAELHLSQPALSETVRNLERELGVDLLDRRRSGAKISDEGRELLPHIISVLESVDRLRRAAHDQHHTSRMVRVGTVNAATAPLLVPAIRAFRTAHPVTQVEVVGAQQDEIHRALREGSFDLRTGPRRGGPVDRARYPRRRTDLGPRRAVSARNSVRAGQAP